MFRSSRILLGCTVASLCIAITAAAQEAPATGGRSGGMGVSVPGGAGRGGNMMVSMTPPETEPDGANTGSVYSGLEQGNEGRRAALSGRRLFNVDGAG